MTRCPAFRHRHAKASMALAVLLALTAAGLGGCGQKGDLYLPDETGRDAD